MEHPFTVAIPVRYRDLDTYGHVNNAVYATYLEEARIAYLEDAIGVGLDEFPFVVASVDLSFERPITREDDLVVAVETSHLGNSSIAMAYELRVGEERVATGETTMVAVDPEEKHPTKIPDALRERVVEYEGLED